MNEPASNDQCDVSLPCRHLDPGEEHRSDAPLRTIFPDHDDIARWGWLQALRSPDTGAIVQAYKLPFVGTLWVDIVGRIYRYRHPSPRLVRLVPPHAPAADLQAPLEVTRIDPECPGCREETTSSVPTEPPAARA